MIKEEKHVITVVRGLKKKYDFMIKWNIEMLNALYDAKDKMELEIQDYLDYEISNCINVGKTYDKLFQQVHSFSSNLMFLLLIHKKNLDKDFLVQFDNLVLFYKQEDKDLNAEMCEISNELQETGVIEQDCPCEYDPIPYRKSLWGHYGKNNK